MKVTYERVHCDAPGCMSATEYVRTPASAFHHANQVGWDIDPETNQDLCPKCVEVQQATKQIEKKYGQ